VDQRVALISLGQRLVFVWISFGAAVPTKSHKSTDDEALARGLAVANYTTPRKTCTRCPVGFVGCGSF
jgi:hypothetical protein